MLTSMWNTAKHVLYTTDLGNLDVTPEETLPPVEDIQSVEGAVDWVSNAVNWVKDYAMDVLLPAAISIFWAVLIFFIGKYIMKKLIKLLEKFLTKSNLEEGTVHFLSSFSYGVGMVILIFIVLQKGLGIATAPVVAILGSAGLAIGLALQGSLSNFAGGILLLFMKPFRVGDYISALGNEGVVTKIDIIYTTLTTGDNKKIAIPNGSLSNANIVNVTKEPVRRVDILVGVDYAEDIRQVKKVLLDIVKKNKEVLQDQEIQVFVDDFAASSVSMGVRVWTNSENYWKVKWDLQEEIKNVFDDKNISIAYDRMDVMLLNEEK